MITWLPGLLFAGLLLVVMRRSTYVLLLPAMVVAASGLFYLLGLLTTGSMAAIRAHGWVLEPLPQAGLWPPVTASALAHVHWAVLGGGKSVIWGLLSSSAGWPHCSIPVVWRSPRGAPWR